MDQNDINVRVTATTDPAKLAFRDVTAEMDRMGKGFAAGGSEAKKLDDQLSGLLSRIDPTYRATKQLSDAVGVLDANLEAGNISAAQHAGIMGKLETAFAEATTGAGGLAHGSAGVTREIIVLGHEVVSGNFSRIPGSLMVLGSRMNFLTLSTLGWAAAIGGTLFAAYEMAASANQAEGALRGLEVAMSAYGKAGDLSREQMSGLIDDLKKLPGVSREMAEQVVGEFARTRNIGGPLMAELSKLVMDFAAASGEDAPRAAKALAEAFNDPAEGAKKLQKEFGLLTPQQMELIEQFNRLGETGKAQEVMFESLQARIKNVSAEALSPLQQWLHGLAETAERLGRALKELAPASYSAAKIGTPDATASNGPAARPTPAGFLSDDAAAGKFKAAADAVKEQNLAIEKGLDLEKNMGLIASRRAELEGKIAQLKAAQAAADKNGDTDTAKRFQNDVREAEAEMASLREKGSGARDKAAREAAKAARQEIDAQRQVEQADVQHAQSQYELKRQELEARRQLGEISAREELTQLQELKDQEYQIELRALERERALLAQRPVDQARVDKQIVALQDKYRLDTQRLQTQAALETRRTWEQAITPITSSFNTAVRSMLTGTMTLRQGVAGVLRGIVSGFAESGLKMAEDWATNKLAMIGWTKLLGLTEDATAAETAAAQTAATTAQGLFTIQAHAAEAGSAAYASTAAIPVIGPELAPAAAAAAYAGAMSFSAGLAVPSAAGGWEVPRDTLAMVHEQEMILPAELSNRIRTMTEPGGGGDVHLHVHAVDAASVKKLFMDNGAALASALSKQVRNFNPHVAGLKG